MLVVFMREVRMTPNLVKFIIFSYNLPEGEINNSCDGEVNDVSR
jgi:hypothetical protein